MFMCIVKKHLNNNTIQDLNKNHVKVCPWALIDTSKHCNVTATIIHWLVAIITHDLHTYLLYCSYACMTSTELRVHNMYNSLNCYLPKLGEKDSERTSIKKQSTIKGSFIRKQ